MRFTRRAVLGGAVGLATGFAAPAIAARPRGERYVDGPLHARLVGDGDPILFVHGLGASGAYWGEHFDVLAREHRLAFVDLAGFGRSLDKPGPFGFEGQLQALMRFRERRLGDAPLTVVGHSFGALLAVLAAARWSGVHAAVALSLPLLEGSLDERKHRIQRMGGLAAWAADDSGFGELSCRLMCALRPLVRELGPVLEPTLPSDVARGGFDHHWHSLRGALDSAARAEPLRWIEAARCPVLVVQGTTDDIAPAAVVRRALSHIAIDVREARAGHQLPLEDPSACLIAVTDALRPRREQVATISSAAPASSR